MKPFSYCLLAGCSLLILALGACRTPPTRVKEVSETIREPGSLIQQIESPDIPPPPPVNLEPSKDIPVTQNPFEVSKDIIQTAAVGGVFKYLIRIEAKDDLKNVRLKETFPDTVNFTSATPSGSFREDQVSWHFPAIAKGDSKEIRITASPETEGNHQICSTVTADTTFCLNLFSGQPKLAIVKKGPPTVELGEEISWTVSVSNDGSSTAADVVVTDTVPDGFSPAGEIRKSIGDLAPGETKSVVYTAEAVRQGRFNNRAVATYTGENEKSSGTSPVADTPVTVVRSAIRVSKTGPEEAYVFKPVIFDISIENVGDTDLENVRITNILPEGAAVTDHGRGRVSGNAIGWVIPKLPAGSGQLIQTKIMATRKGPSTNTVNILSQNGLEASDSIVTNWLAVPGVTIDITDNKDPIREGEPVIYTIQVRNQGNFEPVSGIVSISFNDSIRPISVAGDARGSIEGQTVTFPRTTLEPGKDTTLRITAQGAKIGPGRADMSFSADFLSNPIINQESTNVY